MARSTTTVALSSLAVAALHCSHAWDDYDPRLDPSGGPGGSMVTTTTSRSTSTSSAGGAGGAGGAGSSSSSSSTSTATSSSASTAGGQGGAGGEGGPIVRCADNGANSLVDDFDDGTIGAQWDSYSTPTVTVTEEGGELVIALGAEPVGSFGAISSVGSYDLTDCEVFVKVTSELDPMTKGYAALAAVAGPDVYVELILAGPDLGYKSWDAGGQTYYGDVPYDPVAHRWWRLRESAGTLHYETSPDAATWTTLHSVATPIPLGSVQIQLGGGTYQNEPIAPGQARYDSLNLPR